MAAANDCGAQKFVGSLYTAAELAAIRFCFPSKQVAGWAASDLYHAPGVTPADQAALALMWQATWGIFNAILYVGFFVVPIGILFIFVE